jgi:hypothetical protein
MIKTSSIEFTRWTHEAMHQAEAGLKYGFKVSKDSCYCGAPSTLCLLQIYHFFSCIKVFLEHQHCVQTVYTGWKVDRHSLQLFWLKIKTKISHNTSR